MGRAWDGRRLLAAAVVVVGCASGCATSTSGHGSGALIPNGPTRFPPSTRTPAPPPTPTPTPTASTIIPPTISPPTSLPPSTDQSSVPVITVHGADGSPYKVEMLASDRITDCSAHSYGAPIIQYFRAHPCQRAARRLFAILIEGRVAIMSTIAVSCALGPRRDEYRWTGELYDLERANGTGSVNDLLREGVRVAGVPDSIPPREAFGVFEQDTLVAIEDAWWDTGRTRDQDRTLLAAEQNLFLTPLTSP